MENQINKLQVISNLFWKLMERAGTQGIQFVVQIVLARLLLPEDFGIIALVTIFIVIANVFVHSGLNTALIQKKNADEIDFSSVFFLSLFISGLIYVILFISSPFIADFFREPLLKPILRVISIILFFGALNSVQLSIVSRNLQFKKLFFSSLIAIIISGIIGILLAYNDFRVWALVAQQITFQVLITVILWFTLKWRPMLVFSFERIKSLFSFGWKLLVSSLIDHVYMDIRIIFIGKMYTSAILGFYNNGRLIPHTMVSNINSSIQSVMFPVLSSQQDNKKNVKSMVRRSIVTSSFLIFPIMVGLAVIAEPFVKIVLTEKWLPAVPFIQIFCISFALWPIHTANLQAINALGRSDIFLKLEIIKKVIGLIILAVTLFYGVYAIALGLVLSGVISSVINAYPNRKLLDYSYREQIKDIMPSLLLSLVMGAIVFSIQFLDLQIWEILLLQIFVGLAVYIGLAKLFKLECFTYLMQTGKEIFLKKNR
jgi:teichuronic acid exporter